MHAKVIRRAMLTIDRPSEHRHVSPALLLRAQGPCACGPGHRSIAHLNSDSRQRIGYDCRGLYITASSSEYLVKTSAGVKDMKWGRTFWRWDCTCLQAGFRQSTDWQHSTLLLLYVILVTLWQSVMHIEA